MRALRLAVLAAAAVCAGCSMFQRSPRSGYATSSDGQGNARVTETGDLSSSDVVALDKSRRLRQLESRLESRREKEQYAKVLPWLENDEEKIAFLSLATPEARAQWVQTNGIWKRPPEQAMKAKEVVDAGDLAIGLSTEQVRKSWGEPQSVETSGNPLYRNERWKYVRQVSGQDGYRQERRYVYFEGGRVVGWETE